MSERYLALRAVADSNGWGELYGFMNEVTDQYRQQNETALKRLNPNSSQDEIMVASLQSQPIQVDPNRVAMMRQLATQIDSALKTVDPNASFWETDSGFQLPDFAEVAKWINREAEGSGAPGFMTSGPQEMGAGATASAAALEGATAATDFTLNLLYGGWQLAADALQDMGVDAPAPPTNYIKDPVTGDLIPNTARPNPGLIDLIVMGRNLGDQDAIFSELSALQSARDMEAMQRSGAGDALVAAAQLAGMMGLPPVGKFKGAAGGFTLAMKGMEGGKFLGQRLVGKGLVQLGLRNERSIKILQGMGGVIGAGVANGAMMATAYGRMSDYATQAEHGFAIAPVLLAMGAMGRGAERLLSSRAKMPGSIRSRVQNAMAAAVGGGAEGFAFGVMDDIQTRGLWNYLKDPTPEKWGVYLGNMGSMALLKAVGRAGAGQRQAKAERDVTRAAEYARATEESVGLEEGVQLKPESVKASRGDKGAARELISEQVGPTGKERRKIDKVVDPDAPFGVSKDYRYQRPEEITPEQKAVRALVQAQIKETFTERAPMAEKAPRRPQRDAERQGIGSLSAGPERQVGAVEGTKEITLGDLTDIMGGRRGRAGVPTPIGRVFGSKGDPVQVEFRSGKTEGSLGISKKLGVVRTAVENDIVVMAHEWNHESMAVIARHRTAFEKQEAFEQEARHFIEETKGGLREAEKLLIGSDPEKPLYPGADKWFEAVRDPANAKMDPEFALYKIGSESWAEIGARKMLGDGVRLEGEAPRLMKTHEAVLMESPAIYEQFIRASDAHTRWREQGAVARGIQSAKQTDKKIEKRRWARQGGKISSRARSVKKSMFDDLAEGRAERERAEIAAGVEVGSTPLSADPMRQIDRMVATAISEAETFIERHTIDASGRPTGESLRSVFSKVAKDVTMDEFKNYVNSVRGLEDYKKGLQTTLAKEDYVAILRSLQEKAPVLKELGKTLKAYSGRVVDYLVDQGGMSVSDAAKFKDGRHMHVTLLRAIMEQGGSSGTSSGTGPRSAKGGGGELFDLPEAMVKMTHHYVRMGQKARVNQALLEAAKRGLGHVGEIVPKGAQPSSVDVKSALRELFEKANSEGNLEAMEAIELLEQSGLSAETITLFTGKRWPTKGDKFIVPVLDRGTGETVWVRAGEHTFKAIQGDHVSAVPMNTLAKSARAMSTLFRKAGVEYNPIFAVGAAVRDMMFRGSVAQGGFAKKFRYGFGPLGHAMDLVVGGFDMARGSEFFKRMRDTGVFTAGHVNAQAEIGRIRGEFKQSRGALEKLKKGLHIAASSPTTWTEHAPRLAAAKDVYKQAIKRGLSDRDAFAEAQEAYREEMINFAKGGTMARAVSGYVPFLKAGLLGQQKAFAAMSTKQGVAAAFANITVPAMISMLLYEDEPWFQDLEDYERAGYLHISKDIRLPIPYEVGQLFGAAPQLAYLQARNHPDYAPDSDQWLGLAAEMMVPWMNDMKFTPPAFRALTEVKAGYDFFRNKPIVPEFLTETRTPENQTRRDTGELAKSVFRYTPQFLLDALNVDNPAEMGHLGKALVPGIAPHLVEAAEDGGVLAMMASPFMVHKRFTVDRGHPSKANRLLNERVTDLKQRKAEKKLEPGERADLARLLKAKRKISKLWKDEDLTDTERSDQIRKISMSAMESSR